MLGRVPPDYDVLIMGGGPGGSTLAALLARKKNLRVGLFERDTFPREHIGESLVHVVTPVLEESGVLPKVLASDCWIKKFGGVFNWDPDAPRVMFFEHHSWLRDGVNRWAMHVNRPEFDQILLEHARECGADVFEGAAVSAFEPLAEGCAITLKDGRRVQGRFFVDASGRITSIATRKKKDFLSGFKNIAIWQHYLGCRDIPSLDGDWNIFHDPPRSPVGSFAFVDGWVWYIPVPKILDGERKITFSIGIVTSPSVLKEPGKDYTDPEVFLRTIRREVPILRDLVQDATPVEDQMLTATNYSMISDQFANFDERWILIGDAAFFVDPLFSTGVGFAVNQAAAVALLLETTVNPSIPEAHKRDLWHDYDAEWHAVAESFALSLDQWYYAIGKNNPDSVYWKMRNATIDLDIREQTFQALLNMSINPDLLQVLAGGKLQDLDREGPLRRNMSLADPEEPDAGEVLALSPRAAVRESIGLEVPGFKASIPPPPFELPAQLRDAIARYWLAPMENGATIPSPLAQPRPCHRFYFGDDPDGASVRSMDYRDRGLELWALLEQGRMNYGELTRAITGPQARVLKRLLRAGLATVQAAPATVAP